MDSNMATIRYTEFGEPVNDLVYRPVRFQETKPTNFEPILSFQCDSDFSQTRFYMMVRDILKAENPHEQQVAIEALAAKCWWPGKDKA